jgi:chitosanase
MISPLQKRTIQAIVNVFETGRPAGDYSSVTLARQDTGHLTYGRSQVTLSSGSLARLVRDYCAAPGALLAKELSAYLPLLEARDTRLDGDAALHTLLHEAGTDPAMRRTQDVVCDRVYWDPALRSAQAVGIETSLGTGVVYDSFIHGGWVRMRNATAASLGLAPAFPQIRPQSVTEGQWIERYITLRRHWLATHPNPLLRLTTFRMDTFAALLAAANWALALPLEAHGVRISEEDLEFHPSSGEVAPASFAP